MSERPDPEFNRAEDVDKEAAIRAAEEYSVEVSELSSLLDTARRWARSAGTSEADEAVFAAASAQGSALLGATVEMERGLPPDPSAGWRAAAKADIETIRQMLPDFLR